MTFAPLGFNRLDFAEMKKIAALVGFDILACARKKKSCGPGCDWLVQDKRYYTLMLLQHIGKLLSSGEELPEIAADWYEKAKKAAEEYAVIEEKLYPILKIKKNSTPARD